ncbi:MAG TPA: hypothetical protein VNZ54_01085 [bacterium]|nr:hypothetical protein [bacterium]
MKPDLQFSVLCDDVRREDNGKLMLIGLFEMIAGAQYPMTYPGLAVVNRWCNGQGSYRQKVRLVDSDNRVVVETADSPVELADMHVNLTAVSVMHNVPVPRPGRYWVEVLLDGDLKQRYALLAMQLGPPQAPPAGPGAPPWGAGKR